MKNARRSFAIVTVGLVCLCAGGMLAPAADSPDDKDQLRSKVSVFMRAKLLNSQNVLEGLTTENFDLIRQGAEKMLVMSKAAEWRIGGGGAYALDTAQFVASAQDLIKNAKDRNIDGATVSYLQLTMNCITCHKHIRDEKTPGIPIHQRGFRRRGN